MSRTFASINGWTLTLIEDVTPIELHLRHRDVLMAKALIRSDSALRYRVRSDGKSTHWRVWDCGHSLSPFLTFYSTSACSPFIVKGTVDVPLIPTEEA